MVVPQNTKGATVSAGNFKNSRRYPSDSLYVKNIPYIYHLNYPVKNYWRGVNDFFGVILLKRRRIAGEVSSLWA